MNATHTIVHRRRSVLSRVEGAIGVAGVVVGAFVMESSPSGWLLVTVGGLVLAAAMCDARTGRIPNELVLAGWVTVFYGGLVVGYGEIAEASAGEVVSWVALGVVLSGAAALFVIWLVAPRLVGGGDWKLLSVIGGSLALVTPLAAAVAGFVAVAVQLVSSLALRRRLLPFGPAMLAGFAAGAFSTPWLPVNAGWS